MITRQKVASAWKRRGRPDVTVDVPLAPAAPTSLSSSAITDNSVTLTWTKSVSAGVDNQRIYLNGTLRTTVVNGTQEFTTISGLNPLTSYTWTIDAYNSTTGLASPKSSGYTMTTTGTVVTNAPNAPTISAVKNPSSPSDSINVSWSAPTVDGTHSAATGYRVYVNGTQNGSDIAGGTTTYTINSLNPSSTYAITVKAFNASGASAASNSINVTLDAAAATLTLMGSSRSDYDHGGFANWDIWRVYTRTKMYEAANLTGVNKPKAVAYSEEGQNLGGANPNYATVYAHVLDELNTFYYTTSTGQTHTARWGIKMYWSNGNENFDKGALANPTTANIALYTNNSQKALYDACHYIDPTTGQRRFPDAYAGSNPTQNAEQQGKVQAWLHPSAKYHDFVMWSFYNPGRLDTVDVPTFDWPSKVEADRTKRDSGFLIRCYYRTKQAQAQARIDLGDPNFRIGISCGEVGIAHDPSDSTTRPYYAVYGIAGVADQLATQYDLDLPFLCWFDSWTGEADHGKYYFEDDPVGTNPTTAVAWRNWKTYHTAYGGTKAATWTGNPKSAWKDTGTPIS